MIVALAALAGGKVEFEGDGGAHRGHRGVDRYFGK